MLGLGGFDNFAGPALRRFFRELFSERFLLRRAERRASGCSIDQRGKMRFLLAAARARQRAAAGLRGPEERAPAFRLLAEAFAILMTAHATARGESDGERTLPAEEAWEKLAALAEALGTPPEHAGLAAFLKGTEVLDADRLTAREALALRPALEGLLGWLEAGLEVRTVRRIRVYRVLRLVGVASAGLTLLVATLAWALAPANLAYEKPVRSSSVFPRTPDPGGATDGVRGRGFGVHTVLEHRPWVEIDLGASHSLSEVVVYHRSDGFQAESLPLTLELSEDGSNYVEVATRRELFTASDPWRAKLGGKRARWVRLIISKKDKGYIAVSEIEVYGK